MFPVGSWESFSGFSALGGVIGYVIWCERNKEQALALPAWCHAAHVARNVAISGFLGLLIYFVALHYAMHMNPVVYVGVGIIGMLSVDAAIILVDFAKGVSVDALRAAYNRVMGAK